MADTEVVVGTAGEQLVAQGATLMRIENDVMSAVAIQRPRDEGTVIKRALQELELVPENAGAAYYSIPYRDRNLDGTVKMTRVEGPSIKAAMSLSRRWGNCTVAARTMNEDESGWDLEGVFLDYETNFRVCRPFRVSKFAKKRNGGAYRLDPQRELMALQAGASKAIRNATLAGLPDYLVTAYVNRAREIVGGKLDQKADEKQLSAVIRAFKKLDVTQEQLEQYTKLAMAEWTGSEIADLRGLYNAIQDGQVTMAAALAEVSEPEPVAKPLRASEVNVSANDGGNGEPAAGEPAATDAATNDALRVAQVQVVSGESDVKKNGKPTGEKRAWTRYDVTFSDDRAASSFSHTIGQKAQAALASGAPVEIELAPDGRDGLKLEKLEIVEAKAEPADAPTGEQGTLIPESGSEGGAA